MTCLLCAVAAIAHVFDGDLPGWILQVAMGRGSISR